MNLFSENYPNPNWWLENQGYIEIGFDEHYRDSWLRIIDEGGVRKEHFIIVQNGSFL